MDHAAAQSIYTLATQMAHTRWSSIASFFGPEILRPAETMVPQPCRDPYAPGFGAVPGVEYLAHTYITVELDDAAQIGEAGFKCDQALFRLETQIRSAIRGKIQRGDQPGLAPAILFDAGDRIEVYPLIGAHGAIRVRASQYPGSQTMRVDFEALLRKIPGDECATGASNRLPGAVLPYLVAARSCTEHRSHPTRLMSCGNHTPDGEPFTVAVAVGPAAERLREFMEGAAKDLEITDSLGDDAAPDEGGEGVE